MNKYSQGKIYKLISDDTSSVYIGSTMTSLKQRLQTHNAHYAMYLKGAHHYLTSYELCQHASTRIVLIEKYPCNTRSELEKREYYWMKKLTAQGVNVINKANTCGISVRQADDKNAYSKEYYHLKSHIINAKTDCKCGGRYTKQNILQHMGTKRHKTFVKLEKAQDRIKKLNNVFITTHIHIGEKQKLKEVSIEIPSNLSDDTITNAFTELSSSFTQPELSDFSDTSI